MGNAVSNNDWLQLGGIVAQIPAHENTGAKSESRDFFDEVLADSFAFRRRTGVVVGREDFLNAVETGGDRTVIGEPKIEAVGKMRATARYTVSMTVDGLVRRFDNLQVLIRDDTGAWKLLAWANEEEL